MNPIVSAPLPVLGAAWVPRAALRTLAAAVALLVVLGLWHAALPAFGPLDYRFDEEPPETGALPLSVPSAGKLIHLHTTVRVRAVHPWVFSIVPDDCLEHLSVNGRPAAFTGPICYAHGGGRVSLSGLLHAGVNSVDLDISDNGGKGGLELGVSLADPALLVFFAASLLVLFSYAVSLVRLSSRPRVGYGALLVAAVGLGVRLPFVTAPGYSFDVRLFAGWAKSALELGVGPSYLSQVGDLMLPNYPPFSMEVLAVVGRAYRWLVDPAFDAALPSCVGFMKLPAIGADVLTAVLLFFIVRRLHGGRLGAALTAGLSYACNPAVLYESAVWGQVDAFFCLLALASLATAATRRWTLAGALAALAVLMKLQAFVILPTLALVCLMHRGAMKRLVLGAVSAIAVTLVPVWSVAALGAIKDVYLHSAGFFPVLSMHAYNLWVALFGLKEQDRPDGQMLFGLLSYRGVGLALFGAIALGLPLLLIGKLKAALTQPERAAVLFLLPAATAYAFFLFNTEMHERYLFPMMALGLPLVFVSRAGRYAYIGASALFLLNLLGVLPWADADRALFRELPNLPAAIGACHVFAFGAVVHSLRRAA